MATTAHAAEPGPDNDVTAAAAPGTAGDLDCGEISAIADPSSRVGRRVAIVTTPIGATAAAPLAR